MPITQEERKLYVNKFHERAAERVNDIELLEELEQILEEILNE